MRYIAWIGEAGVASVLRVGNMKCDIEVPAAQRELASCFRLRIASGGAGARPVLLFASTREGEEEEKSEDTKE